MVSLIIGGARSGKSRFAQSLGANARRAFYIATARAEDAEMEARIAEHRHQRPAHCAEMEARIAEHRHQRPAHWCTIEAPLDIAGAVEHCRGTCDFVLLDCLTVWLSNFCWEHRSESERDIETAALAEVALVAPIAIETHVVIVTNEVGCGIVPETPLGRFFRDLQGRINQEAARLADQVILVVAGIPVIVKQPETGQ
jgi:adenosylcobinamide kinase/adenosylcobinamide-phosphate guanylyltransferase